MNVWVEKKISDLGKVITGKTPPKDQHEFYDNGDKPFVSPKDLDWNQFYVFETETKITDKAFDKHKNQILPKNSIMFTSLSFAFGKMGITSESCLTNQQINSIIVNQSHDYRFVYYLLQQYRPLIFSYNSGIDTPIVPKSVFESIPVRCPTIEIQKKIAAILSAYDDLIENNNRRIALLENMAEEIYREWFVRFRFPGYKTTKFEKGIPKEWFTKTFRELVDFYIGGGWGEEIETPTFSKGAYVIRGTDIPPLAIGDYSNKIFRYHTPSNFNSRKILPNDFIFEVSGGSKDQLLGRNIMITKGLLDLYENNVICASFCKQIRFKDEIISPYFIKYFLKLYYELDLVGIYQIQSTGISNYQFEAFLNFQTLKIPTKELQEKFSNLIKPIIEEQENLAFQNVNLTETKNMLLPRLLSGKLLVSELNIQTPPSMSESKV